MKRTWMAGLLTVVMLLTLTACGSSVTTAVKSEPMENAADCESSEDFGGDGISAESEAADSSNGSSQISQKLICTAQLELETTEFDTAVSALADLTEQYEGYFENTTIYQRGNSYRSADYTIRVPIKNYELFLNRAGELCHETWRNTNQEDVTESYYDTQGRLKTQQIKLQRLQELLSKATDMKDIITIESAISETEWNIESLSGTLRHYDALVDYATVSINLNEVYKLSNVAEKPDSFGARMGDAFMGGLRNFGNTLENLAVAFAYSWIWWGLLVVIAVVLVRALKHRKLPRMHWRKKKADDKQNET